jgi:hypothetical protein
VNLTPPALQVPVCVNQLHIHVIKVIINICSKFNNLCIWVFIKHFKLQQSWNWTVGSFSTCTDIHEYQTQTVQDTVQLIRMFTNICEREPTNRSQMDIKHKIYNNRTWKKRIFPDRSSTKIDTLVPSLFLRVESRSTQVIWQLSQPLPHLVGHHLRLSSVLEKNFSTRLWTSLREKHFPPYTENISLWTAFAFCPFGHKKTHNRKLFFGLTLLKHGRHFDNRKQPLNMRMSVCYLDCRKQPLNMRMRVCYLDCHESGLCCYVVIHIQNLLHPLQLFYFNLWPIYWFSLVYMYPLYKY